MDAEHVRRSTVRGPKSQLSEPRGTARIRALFEDLVHSAFLSYCSRMKRILMRHTARHVRCTVVLTLAVLSRTGVPFILFGLFNSRRRVVRSVFFCYAGSARYAHHYRYSSTSNFLRWYPTPIGVFQQGRTWGLVCASPVTESEFTDPRNRVQLQLLTERLSRFRRLLAADHVSLAGILPSYLKRSQLEPIDINPIDRTAEVVTIAVQKLRQEHFMLAAAPKPLRLVGLKTVVPSTVLWSSGRMSQISSTRSLAR
jgi:hypothetical protein